MKEKEKPDGWILIDRRIRDHWIYTERPFSRFQAWIDLIMSANFRDKTIIVNGKPFLVRRGSFLTSVRKLSIRWGWGKDKAARFLATLRADGMIETETHIGTLITIVKYGVYQFQRDSKSDTRETRTRHARDRDQSQEKERRKKEKERKEEDRDFDDDDDGMSAEEYTKWREAQQNGTV